MIDKILISHCFIIEDKSVASMETIGEIGAKLNEVIETVNSLTEKPVAEKQEPKFGEWTSFKKQLPPLAEWVYVSCIIGDKPFIGALTGYYDDNSFTFEVIKFFSNCTVTREIAIDDTDYLAWMPLPEPYKGGVVNG